MKGPTLRERWVGGTCQKPTVLKAAANEWNWGCDAKHPEPIGGLQGFHHTQPEAFAAAHRHALEHLGEDMGRWAEQLPPLTDDEVPE